MMDDSSGTGFPESTSRICWFSLSSLFFKSTSGSTSSSTETSASLPAAPSTQGTPNSTPVRRRTSPRLQSRHCCLLNQNQKEDQDKDQEPFCSCEPEPAILQRNGYSNRHYQKERTKTEDGSAGDARQPSLLSVDNDTNAHQNHKDKGSCCPTKSKSTHGLSLKDAPAYLTFNPYITGGYRNNLAPADCLKSLFWWTNETLNIWSHLLGWLGFFYLSLNDVLGLSNLPKTQPWDQLIFTLLLVCFQACMILSAAYHVFCCCSERSYRQWLSMDLLGVSLSLLAIYISGIYYAFSCVPSWLNFYLSTVGAIFVCCLTCTFLRSSDGFSNRLLLFGGWAAYGIVPTVHWAILHGGFKSEAVALLLPRIFWMYAISALAFFFYVTRLPERWRPGLVNYVGSSHQIWHVLIVAALYHWHNTGLLYMNYRAEHPCSEEYAALFPQEVAPAPEVVANGII